jgi:hypothetical protein
MFLIALTGMEYGLQRVLLLKERIPYFASGQFHQYEVLDMVLSY